MGELLILEGEPMVGRILEHKLRREGHAVTWLRAPAAGRPGDGHRAGGGGPRRGLARAGWPAAPPPGSGWFAICDHDDEEAAQRAVRAGAAGVIRKPFKPTEVAAQVRTLLEVGA